MANISYTICPRPLSEVDRMVEQVNQSIKENLVGYIGREWGQVVRSEIVDDVMHVWYQAVRPLHRINVTVTLNMPG